MRYGVDVAQHRTDYNLYEGWQLKGFPGQGFLAGTIDCRWEKLVGKTGLGHFVNRNEGEILR